MDVTFRFGRGEVAEFGRRGRGELPRAAYAQGVPVQMCTLKLVLQKGPNR